MARYAGDHQQSQQQQQQQQQQHPQHHQHQRHHQHQQHERPVEHSMYYARPHTNLARQRYSPFPRQASPGSSVSPSPASNYYSTHSGNQNQYPAEEGSQTFHAPKGATDAYSQRIHPDQPFEDQSHHRSDSHRNSQDYSPRHRSFSHPRPPAPSPYTGPEGEYHHVNGVDQRDREGRRIHHSSSASSLHSNASTSTLHNGHHAIISPPISARNNSSSHPMEAPMTSNPHRSMYPAAGQGSGGSELLQHRSSISPSPSLASAGLEHPHEGTTIKPRANSQQTSSIDRKVSCLECRSSKVKCSGQMEVGEPCERCKRIKRECIFEQHRRGRKPAQLKMHKLEQSVDTIMTALNALTEYQQKSKALRESNEDDAEGARDSLRPFQKRSHSDTTTDTASTPSKRFRPTIDEDVSNRIQGRVCSNTPKEQIQSTAVKKVPMREANSPLDLDATRLEPVQDQAMEPTEGTELGLPPLSNPLKLLAQASDFSLHRENPASSIGEMELAKIKDPYRPKTGSSDKEETKRGASRREYWSLGLYSSRFDKGPALDPIACKIMTKAVAKDLFGMYIRHLNARITLLDPFLATFGYVRNHSAFLLTSACALAARFASHISNAEELANRLDVHLQEKVLPAVLLQGYRSVEISQAFIIMAAYHANTSSLDGDRSWSLLGYGIRIAAELDMNARMISNRERVAKPAHTPVSAQADTPLSNNKDGEPEVQMSSEEAIQRKLRNRERTWCNLWLFENSLSTHMGRRSTLGQDPVILGVSAGWDRATYAIPGDEAIVAIINLRRLQTKNFEFFEHSVLSDMIKQSEDGTPKETASASFKFQLEFYRKSCGADLDAWRSMYVESDEGQSVRMKNGRLYLCYASLILNSYALKCTVDQALLEPIYKESYAVAMSYLTIFSERLESPELVYVHNSAVVTVAYVAVFALRLCSLDPKRYTYIDSTLVFNLVRALSKALARAGSVTPWRNGAASSYAPYLSAVLLRVEKTIGRERESENPIENMTPSSLDQLESGHDKQRNIINRYSSTLSKLANEASKHHVNTLNNESDSLAFSISPPMAIKRLSFDHAMKLGDEALSYMAGPSGVQASSILEESASNQGLQFSQNFFEDQVMDDSLFSDMNVFLNNNLDQYTWTTSHSQQQQQQQQQPGTIGKDRSPL